MVSSTDTILAWLLEGDLAIRWQVRRDLLRSKQMPDRRWKQGHNWPGRVFFVMETGGQPGRWNTLAGLRVLKWWDAQAK